MSKTDLAFPPGSTQLLVSVRSAEEAASALAGGAQIIDVKEPSRGSLGAADDATVAQIVQTVAARAPVTMALGELVDFDRSGPTGILPLPPGVALFKLGLSGCADRPHWREEWRSAIEPLRAAAEPVGVIYADAELAHSPAAADILDVASEMRFPAVLVDTWRKGDATLLDHWSLEELERFLARARAKGLAVALAGSLRGPTLRKVAALAPSVIAVRGAACVAGRESAVSARRVAELRALVDSPSAALAEL